MDIKKELNEKQYEAVTNSSQYLRIIAGAGSGKTRVLTYRISYLIKDGRIVGKNPAQILPEVVIKPRANTPWKAAYLQSKRNPNWRSTYDMNPDMNSFNAVTGGIFN